MTALFEYSGSLAKIVSLSVFSLMNNLNLVSILSVFKVVILQEASWPLSRLVYFSLTLDLHTGIFFMNFAIC